MVADGVMSRVDKGQAVDRSSAGMALSEIELCKWEQRACHSWSLLVAAFRVWTEARLPCRDGH
jgi:hypothetical protein